MSSRKARNVEPSPPGAISDTSTEDELQVEGQEKLGDPNEPLWARDRPLEGIRHVCRGIGLKEAAIAGKTRTELISQCGYLNRFPQFRNDLDTLRQKCGAAKAQMDSAVRGKKGATPDVSEARLQELGVAGMSVEELEKCIVDARAEQFLAALKIQDVNDTAKEIEKLGLPAEVAANLVASSAEGTSQAVQLIQAENYTPAAQAVMINLVQSIQAHLKSTLTKELRNAQQENKDATLLDQAEGATRTGKSTGATAAPPKPLWRIIAGAIGTGLKVLVQKGVDLVAYIITNPKTAYLILLIARELRRQLCRKISIRLGYLSIRENKTWKEKLAEMYASGYAGAKEVLWWTAESLLSGANFESTWKVVSGLVSSVSGYLTGGFSVVVGPAFSYVSTLIGDSLKTAVREGAEFYFYQTLLGSNFTMLFELVDFRTCLVEELLTCDQAQAEGINDPKCRRGAGDTTVTGGAEHSRANRWWYDQDAPVKELEARRRHGLRQLYRECVHHQAKAAAQWKNSLMRDVSNNACRSIRR